MTQRNLIAHIWPGPTGTWRRTVEHLLSRWDAFDQRIFAIAYDLDEQCDEVLSMIEKRGHRRFHDFRFHVTKNDSKRGESKSFYATTNMMDQMPREGHSLYCHTKGASYGPPGSPPSATNPYSPTLAHNWADVMFHLCLDYPALVEATLQDHPIAGPFRRVENRMGVPWHYSGTFFWFRNRDVFSRDWRQPMEDRNDVERWPARVFTAEESGDLGLADCRNLYDEINWRSWITRRFQKEIQWGRKGERVKRAGLPATAFEPLREIYGED